MRKRTLGGGCWAGGWRMWTMMLIGLVTVSALRADTALILSSTVTGGAGSLEALEATALGLTAEVATPAQWALKTTADFSTYRLIVLGDATCTSLSVAAAAIANAATWGAAVNGNIIINGTDPVFHQSQGGLQLTNKSIDFAAAQVGKTGLYVSLSCYYDGAALLTPVPLLSGIGTFTVRGVGCYNDAHIVATHPALTGLTDANLSNWSCSVHEAFDSWPTSNFQVLAIARGIGGSYTAPDGSVGTPYILASGQGLVPIGGGGCPPHRIHGHISTVPPSHSGNVSHQHHGQHGHIVPIGCVVPHVPGHGPAALTADSGESSLPSSLPTVLDFVAARGGAGALNVARRGEAVELFGSAEGLFLDAPDERNARQITPPASGSPLYHTTRLPEVRIGGVPAQVTFSGLAPGLEGVWQINVIIPANSPAGKVPVSISYEGEMLRSVDITIE